MRTSPALRLALAGAAVAALVAVSLARKKRPLRARYDYGGRSGFPRGTAETRGAAADVARDALKWLSRPGSEVLPASRVRAMTTPQPGAPA